MWIFTIYGFYSATAAYAANGKPDPDQIMVRARSRDHLLALKERFGTVPAVQAAPVVETTTRDYRFRIILPKVVWVDVLAKIATEVEYSNFKDAVGAFQPQDDGGYVAALHRIWSVMYGVQCKLTGPGIYSRPLPPSRDSAPIDLYEQYPEAERPDGEDAADLY